MKQYDNKQVLLNVDDPMLYLATSIVYSGVVARDDKFFRSNWARTIFEGLGIDADPLDWYHMIMDRKERAKHGNRRS